MASLVKTAGTDGGQLRGLRWRFVLTGPEYAEPGVLSFEDQMSLVAPGRRPRNCDISMLRCGEHLPMAAEMEFVRDCYRAQGECGF